MFVADLHGNVPASLSRSRVLCALVRPEPFLAGRLLQVLCADHVLSCVDRSPVQVRLRPRSRGS